MAARKASGPQKAQKAPGKALARPEDVPGLAVSTYDTEDIGAGFEGVTQDDLLIPFLNILQKTSPQVDESMAGYIDGADAGMIMNSVTMDLYPPDEGVLFLPVHRDHNFVEWVPRDQGGGFVGIFQPEDPMVEDARRGGAFGKLESPDGNDLVETFYVYGMLIEEDTGAANPAVIAFSSTQIRPYKRWMTQMRSIQLRAEDGRRVTPPMFAHLFRLKTRSQSNAKGSWYGWDISFAEQKSDGANAAERSRLAPQDEFFLAAKELRSLIQEKATRVDYGAATVADVAEDEEAY